MKVLKPMIFTIALAMSVTTFANDIELSSEEISQTVSPKLLLELEIRIEGLKEELNAKSKSMETIDSLTEGKIVAAMINMIETNIALAEEKLASIVGDADLNQENINEISSILDQTEKIISEL